MQVITDYAIALSNMTYTLAELEALPTLSVSQCDDLKIETDNTRVWLSRMSIEDGQPYNNQVTVEKITEGKRGARWEITEQYEAI